MNKVKFNLKKNKLITILDIGLIIIIFFFVRSYLDRYNKNSVNMTRDKIKYTILINNQKIHQEELLNIRLRIENKSNNKQELLIKNGVPFNYTIERNGKLIYKRDVLDSISRFPKKIYLNRYGKTEFSSEWYGIDLDDKIAEKGQYLLKVYSSDLNIKLTLNFEII